MLRAMRRLAIGDIHGCNTALTHLLHQMEPTSSDQLVFVGDYIDRGPASRQVIDSLLELKKTCSPVFLRGNHEVMILDARESFLKSDIWQSYGGLETTFSYGSNFGQDWVAAIPELHWGFLEQTARFFETKNHIFVHACLDPELDLPDQPDWLLFWEFFDRIRPHKSGKPVICGHSPQRSGLIKDLGFAVCIDTGAAMGGWLTCLDVDCGKYWQSNEKGATRAGTLRS
jgi:serine/threonine protein phosphatase 1